RGWGGGAVGTGQAPALRGRRLLEGEVQGKEARGRHGAGLGRWGRSEFPAFYADRSGLTLDHRADTPELAAEALHAQRDRLGLKQAILLTVPPPPEVTLARDEVDRALVAAEAEAKRQGVTGKAVTPFLLSRLVEATGGRTLRANVALLARNARVAPRSRWRMRASGATPAGDPRPEVISCPRGDGLVERVAEPSLGTPGMDQRRGRTVRWVRLSRVAGTRGRVRKGGGPALTVLVGAP
ncbi:MAG TPA: pseudouridine-5'-phosphate glycosidase, partial [Vicinamibacteria bacterium]|nr:pseudouridine-5'-phosphate glycosidase [Vicinamibacteria bacterium]